MFLESNDDGKNLDFIPIADLCANEDWNLNSTVLCFDENVQILLVLLF
jgi:hypothetical protein